MPDKNLYLTKGFGDSEVYVHYWSVPGGLTTSREIAGYLSSRTHVATLCPAIGQGIMVEKPNGKSRHRVFMPDGTIPPSMEAAAEVFRRDSDLEKIEIVDLRTP